MTSPCFTQAIRRLPVFILLLTLAFLSACQAIDTQRQDAGAIAAPAPQPAAPSTEALPREPVVSMIAEPTVEELDNLWDRIAAGFELQGHVQHPEVQRELGRYRDNQALFDLVSARAAPFLYEIVRETEARDLPLELALLPVVESTFDPNAYSPEHAVGLWQFMGATANSFGLQQDWWYDARRNPLAASPAALEYLQILQQRFDGDWLLALAAYNTGEGNVRRAMRRADARDFWSLPLSRETRSHVPRLLAITLIVKDPAAYGVELPPIANTPVLASVEIDTQIELARAAALAGLEVEELQALNPGYRQWATHPEAPQNLFIPADHVAQFEAELATLDRDSFVTWDRYAIRPGDTLGNIARRLGTRVDILQQANNLRGSQIIAGRSLLIPRGYGAATLTEVPQRSVSRNTVAVPQTYRVRRGDNLWTIARRYGLRSQQIAEWNDIEADSLLMPGQVLDLSFAARPDEQALLLADSDTLSYRVRPGDSLSSIARRFGLGVEDLLLMNQISINDLIFPGQQLQIRRQPTSDN